MRRRSLHASLCRSTTIRALPEYAWQQLLQAQLERFKRYPRRARGAHGKVTVAFTVGRNGSVVSSHIIQGSGSAILDEEALALIKRAQPSPPRALLPITSSISSYQ